MPFFVSPGTLIDYNFYVVGRDMSKIDSKEDPRGRKDRNNHLKVLPVEEWKDAWKEYVSLDEKVCREGVGGRMPEGTNCLLSTVHRFYAVKEYDRNRRKKGNNHNGFLNGNISDDSKFQVDCRMKSGSEFSYKLVTCMSGLEDKPGKPRESIVDLSGIRLIFNEDFEYKSVGFHQSFMNNYKGDCKGSLILQRLRSDVTIKEFLKNIKSTKLRNFCKEIITIEDRLDILSAEDVEQLERKYYTELLIPFSTITGSVDCFGKNVVNGLTYTLENFKKTHEKRDDFLYRGRAEDWRNEHWSFFEWSILELLKDLLDGQSSWYIGQITKSKLGKDLDLF